jgi:hypothetical protein
MESVKRREIGCPLAGAAHNKELFFQEEIFRNEGPRAARTEQFSNRGQNVGEEQK